MHWTKLISSEVHLLKGKVIQDICRAPVVYQHPSSWIINNNQGDNDGIVMKVMYSWGIFVRESDCLLVWSPRLGRSSWKLDILHYLQVCLSWPRRLTCWTSPNNHSDFSERRSWRLLYLRLQLFNLVVSSKEIPQFPLSNEILNRHPRPWKWWLARLWFSSWVIVQKAGRSALPSGTSFLT